MSPSPDETNVGSVMHEGIVSCPADAPATDVARAMADGHVHCVFVMHRRQDASNQEYVWGIISDIDLMRAALSGNPAMTADALANQPMITVKPETPLREAAALMVRNKVSHVVVVDPEKLEPIGVLSTSDIAALFAEGPR